MIPKNVTKSWVYKEIYKFFRGNEKKTVLWFVANILDFGDVSPLQMIRLGRYKELKRWVKATLADLSR